MTREEIISWLLTLKEVEGEDITIYEEDVEALKMAINSINALDKIRAEIKEKFEGCDICEWLEDYDYEENNISEYQSVGDIEDILQIIDKYKTESEDKE